MIAPSQGSASAQQSRAVTNAHVRRKFLQFGLKKKEIKKEKGT